jgi:hypothetical protein
MEILRAIIAAVADAKDMEPEELELVLQDYIDVDAIERLDGHRSDLWTLQFELPEHTVIVSGDGTILVDGTQ